MSNKVVFKKNECKAEVQEVMSFFGLEEITKKTGEMSNITKMACEANGGYGNAYIFEVCEQLGLGNNTARDIIGLDFSMGVNWGGLSTAPIGEGVLA